MSGKAVPKHLRDHVWDTMDGWLEAEAQTALNKERAQAAADTNDQLYFPRVPHKKCATLRPQQKGRPEPINHVPGEDPALWEKAHHFKRFASRPEMIHDSVWSCTGYASEGLPAALAKLIPEHSPLRRTALKTAAKDQLLADGSLPPPLPRYRKLWSFQKREISLTRQLTVPPRPPQTLEEKFPHFHVVQNPKSDGVVARDSCVAGCCGHCGQNARPWNGLPMNALHRPDPKAREAVVTLPRSYIIAQQNNNNSSNNNNNNKTRPMSSSAANRRQPQQQQSAFSSSSGSPRQQQQQLQGSSSVTSSQPRAASAKGARRLS